MSETTRSTDRSKDQSKNSQTRQTGKAVRKKGKKHLAKIISLRFASDLGRKDIGIYTGNIAFFFFLSLIPLLILISSILPFTRIEASDLIAAITSVTPDIADGLIASMVYQAYSASTGLLPISLLVLIWSCSRAMLALIQGLNDVYNVEEHRGYLSLCLTSIIYTVLMLIVIIGMMALGVFGELIRKNAIASLEARSKPETGLLVTGLGKSQYILLLLVAVLIFVLIYTFVPSGHRHMLYQLPGALFTTIAWEIFSFFFKLYVNGSNKYVTFYGSLATLAILMFWMYCCIYILLIGGHVNAFFRPAFRRYFRKHAQKSSKKKKVT